MSAPATDTKDPERPDYIKTAGAVLASAGTVAGIAVAQPADTVLRIVTIVLPLALVGVAFPLWYLKKAGLTTDRYGKPNRVRRFPKWLATACWWSAGVTALVFLVMWLGFRDDVVPVVVLDEFKGTEFIVTVQPELRTHQIYVRLQSLNAPPPPEEDRIPPGNFTAYPAAVATLTRHGTGKVVIDTVRVQVDQPHLGEVVALTGGHLVPPAVLPNQYIVKIARGQKEAEGQLYRDGKPSTALPSMDDKNPIARLHVGMEGDRGLYLVKLVITVRDERGRKQTVTSDGWVVVNTTLKRKPLSKEEQEILEERIKEGKNEQEQRKAGPGPAEKTFPPGGPFPQK